MIVRNKRHLRKACNPGNKTIKTWNIARRWFIIYLLYHGWTLTFEELRKDVTKPTAQRSA